MVNIAVVIGKLTKPPEARRLPSGLSLANFDVRVVAGRVRRRFLRAGGSTRARAAPG
jgi:single-stranded DNA-binding protein